MTSRIVRLMISNVNNTMRSFHGTSYYLRPWEPDRRSGYPVKYMKPLEKQTVVESIRDGYRQLFEELALLKEEVKDNLMFDPIMVYRPDEIDVQWRFGNDPKILDKWVVTCDSDYNEGYSVASLQLSSTGKGVFSGNIDTRLPDDGKIKRAGYCNIKAIQARKSFYREAYYNWLDYTHLVLRIRGDGRNYMVNLSTKGYYDITWNDLYQYVLFTRGGPYWQTVKIAFSKFFLASKGNIQDKQCQIPLDQIHHLNITAADIPGPFKLEIDYVGVVQDPMHMEDFAYEEYQVDKYVVGA